MSIDDISTLARIHSAAKAEFMERAIARPLFAA